MFEYIYADSDKSIKTQFSPTGRELFYEGISSLPSGYLELLKNYYSSNDFLLPKYAGFTIKENFLFPSTVQFQARKTQPFIDLTKKDFTPSYTIENFNDLYPIAVRYTDNKNIWLIERPPFKASINFRNTRSNLPSKKDHTFDIWVPWTLMALQVIPEESYYNAYLYFNDGPISSKDDLFIPCLYPNMYNDARMCLNETSVLLQQHLSSTQKFDISTIYNFIINDYMSGGWNVDLGVGYFQANAHRLKNTPSSPAFQAYNSIAHGDSSKKITPSLTPYGRISYKKYTLNFLKYFSQLTLEEVTSIVTDFKTNSLTKTSAFSLNSLIERGPFSNALPTTHQHYSEVIFPKDFRAGGYIDTKYMVLMDHDFAFYLDSDSVDAVQKSKEIIIKIHDLLVQENDSSIKKLVDHERDIYSPYSDFRSFKENNYIIVTPDTVEMVAHNMGSDFYLSTFPKLTTEPANVV